MTKMRSNNYHSVKLVAPSGGVTKESLIHVSDLIGMVFDDADEGAKYLLVYFCEKIMVPKITGAGSAFGIGESVYYDDTLQTVTPIQAAGLWRIGKATEEATDDDDEVEIELEGKLPLVEV